MMMPEFEQMLQAVLPAIGKTSLTLTDIPAREDQLMEMLETALISGNKAASRLTEIHLPLKNFPAMASQFWHVPVEDSGTSDVLRLVFES
jgi:hypothetical protein